MHLTLLNLLFTFPIITTSLSPIFRNAPFVLTAISDFNTVAGSLTTAVNAFDGTLFHFLPQSLAVVGAETKLDLTILEATRITQQSSNFTAEESLAIVGALACGIGPIQTSLVALKGKYPEFKKALTASIVLLDLKLLSNHTGGLIDALNEKVTADAGGLLGLGRAILEQAFDGAIAVYSA